MKNIVKALFLPLFLSTALFCQEPLVIVEKEPQTIFWTNVGSTWILATIFKDAEVKTYFDAPPPEEGVGIAPDRLPAMQQITYRPAGKTFTVKECRFIQHLDGTKSWGFSYPDTFEYQGKKYGNICVFMAEKPEFEAFYIISQINDLPVLPQKGSS